MRLWLARLLLALCALAPLAAAAQGTGEFDAFWTAFREAVQSDDTEAVAAFARFPLAVNGTNDGDEPRKVAQDTFADEWPRWLAQNSGIAETPESLRDAVLRSEAAAILARGPNRRTSGRAVRFSSLYFEKLGGHWRLTRIYEDR